MLYWSITRCCNLIFALGKLVVLNMVCIITFTWVLLWMRSDRKRQLFWMAKRIKIKFETSISILGYIYTVLQRRNFCAAFFSRIYQIIFAPPLIMFASRKCFTCRDLDRSKCCVLFWHFCPIKTDLALYAPSAIPSHNRLQ